MKTKVISIASKDGGLERKYLHLLNDEIKKDINIISLSTKEENGVIDFYVYSDEELSQSDKDIIQKSFDEIRLKTELELADLNYIFEN